MKQKPKTMAEYNQMLRILAAAIDCSYAELLRMRAGWFQVLYVRRPK